MENHHQDGAQARNRETDFPLESALMGGEALAHRRFSWEAALRAMFLLLVTGLIVMVAWRSGASRLSFVFSFGGPSRGERLAWKAEDDPPLMKTPAPGSPPPPEWRLAADHFTNWHNPRYARTRIDLTTKSIVDAQWPRETNNAWSWEDDVPFRFRKRSPGQPAQLPMTSFRAGDLVDWPRPVAEEAREPDVFRAIPVVEPPRTGSPASTPVPSLPAAPPGTPGLSGLPGLPALPAPLARAETPAPAEARRDAPTGPVLLGDAPARPVPGATGTAEGDAIDWKNREITGPIDGAFLTIYPKLKFIGLCLPGQGYIRSYHEVGVPEFPEGGKMSAQDGRVPHGRYYIADRYRDADGPRLFLSWPSPEDARRIGLDPMRQMEVENAWRRRELPPQDTDAGGGVGITGLRRWVEFTEGGFALEAPQMEEIFTALPDKAWVIIQDD
ncbi:MAG: hypothetical protein LBJ46_00895 [Planctomycetota bacterium]|jgi:hypothetical protein|nr:hypothetical protein [Planctomycetota bacterium]